MPNETHEQLPADQELDARLAVISEAVAGLMIPAQVVEDIENELDILADEEADPEALNAIHSNAIVLLDAQERLSAAFASAMEIAHTLKAQREKARKGLDELRDAIARVDDDVPEIAELIEMLRDEQDEAMWYALDELLLEQITANTPFDYTEGNHLLTVLEGGDLEADHYLWGELRDWIRRALATIETGICPEPEAS